MLKRNFISIIAVVAAFMVLPALAQTWPEPHSGSYLGVQITALTSQRAASLKAPDTTGAVIVYVDQDGPACRAGLLENDVIVGYDGTKIDNPEQLQSLIHATAPQKTVTMTVVRGGQRKDVKVTLGSWNVMAHARAFTSARGGLAAPAPPRAFPDFEIPSFTLLSARHGLVVESLSPQLSDYFGVARGQGVLVRAVEGGSPAAAAGLKAGDVILSVNNEVVHDMSDWQRGMRTSGNKVSVIVWRDKRDLTVVMTVPVPRDSSRMLELPQFASPEMLAQLGPSRDELEQMRRELQESFAQQQQDMQKMARELAQSAKPSAEDMQKMREEIQRSVPTQKQMDEIRRQVQQSMPTEKDFDKMRQQLAAVPDQQELRRQIQAAMPSEKEWADMRRQIEKSMKDITPQIQQQMDQLKKEMEKQKLDRDEMMREFDSSPITP